MCVVYPSREIKRLFPFVFVLRIQVFAQKLEGAREESPSAQKLAGSSHHRLDDDPYPVHILTVHVHTVVGLYPLPAEVYRRTGPMGVIVIDGDKEHIFRKYVELCGQCAYMSFVKHTRANGTR